MKTVWFRVTGRVQGVGFRNYVVEVADSLGLVGEVWNTRDRAVEGIAKGDKTDLFVSMLQKGPGYVDSVVTSATTERDYDDFIISQTR